MEYWDLYDEEGRPLGRTHQRELPMKKGEYHLGVDIWTVNSKGQILVTLRDPLKEDLGGEWENTCGSVLSGESAIQGAVRELFEETGIRADPTELAQIAFHRGGSTLSYTYILRRDVPIEDIVFQPGETVDAKYVTVRELEEMIARPTGARPLAQRWPFVSHLLKSEG